MTHHHPVLHVVGAMVSTASLAVASLLDELAFAIPLGALALLLFITLALSTLRTIRADRRQDRELVRKDAELAEAGRLLRLYLRTLVEAGIPPPELPGDGEADAAAVVPPPEPTPNEGKAIRWPLW